MYFLLYKVKCHFVRAIYILVLVVLVQADSLCSDEPTHLCSLASHLCCHTHIMEVNGQAFSFIGGDDLRN